MEEEIKHISGDAPDFEQMFTAYKKDNLILLDGGFCHFNHRRDNGLTIYSIFSQRTGMGDKLLELLKKMNPQWIRAVCPQDLKSNTFYESRFELLEVKHSKTGRALNVWQMNFPQNPTTRLATK
jgi:hypothetical protein